MLATRGDVVQDRPLAEVGGKGLFTHEMEEALLAGQADLAVHSLKDLPTALPHGLALAAVGGVQDPRDVLISRDHLGFAALPSGASIGTSSLRRQAQLRHARPDLHYVGIRGNVDSRLRKLEEGQVDAIVLAGAGLARLGLEGEITEWMSTDLCLPAAGQGLLGVEIRADDCETAALVGVVKDDDAWTRAAAERAALAALGGGCQAPVGVHARVGGDEVSIEGVIVGASGEPYFRARETAAGADAQAAGVRLAERLRAMGAADLLG